MWQVVDIEDKSIIKRAPLDPVIARRPQSLPYSSGIDWSHACYCFHSKLFTWTCWKACGPVSLGTMRQCLPRYKTPLQCDPAIPSQPVPRMPLGSSFAKYEHPRHLDPALSSPLLFGQAEGKSMPCTRGEPHWLTLHLTFPPPPCLSTPLGDRLLSSW